MYNKVLLINLPSKDKSLNRDMAGGLGFSAGEGVVLPPIDMLNLATTLINKKYEVIFVDGISERLDDSEYYVNLIKEKKIDVVLGNLSLPTIDEDIEFFRILKKTYPNLKTIVKTGINYQEIIKKIYKESGTDLVIFGECDLIIDKYIEGKIKDGKGEIIENLDLLPVPARELGKIDSYKYSLLPGVVTTIQTSRGCPYPCGYYCPYPLVQGKKWRSMSAERVIKELESIVKLGIKNVLFRDATFTLDMERTKNICKLMIDKKIKINWWCETRVNVLNEELLKIMKKAGCKGINVGVETLDEKLIKSEGKPGVSVEDIARIRRAAKELGIKIHFLMIVGLPNENIGTIKKSFDYLIRIKPETVGITAITPYPGTKMFEEASSSGLIRSFDWNKFKGTIGNMRTKYLSQFEIEMARKMLIATSIFLRYDSWWSKTAIFILGSSFKAWAIIKK